MDRSLAVVALEPEEGTLWVFKIVLDLLDWVERIYGTVYCEVLILILVWIGLEMVSTRLRLRGLIWRWLERWWEGFPKRYWTARSLASACFYYYFIILLRRLPAIVWVAACIYFAWSPELARVGFVVCWLCCRWISAFTAAHIPRVSYAHREGLIQMINGVGKDNGEEEKSALASHITHRSHDSAGGLDVERHIFIRRNKLHNEEDRDRAETRRDRRNAPFYIPRPWDRDAPTLASENVDDLVDFFENVEDIIELGRVDDDNERKALVTSYLPIRTRDMWRELKTYNAGHSYADFRIEILSLYPEIAEQQRGSLACLEELGNGFRGIQQNEEGRLRRFGLRFCGVVNRLKTPLALITNRDACIKYLKALDRAFAGRVRKAVDEREVARVSLRQLGAGLNDSEHTKEHAQRKEDVIDLRDLVEIAEVISQTDTTYLFPNESDTGPRRQKSPTALPAATLNRFGQNEYRELLTAEHDALQVFAQNETAKIAPDLLGAGYGDDTDERNEISERLTQVVHEFEIIRRKDCEEMLAWYRDEFGILWDAMKAVEKGVSEELDITRKQFGESQHGVEQLKIEVDSLHEELFSDFDVLRDEVRTIRVRLRNAQICGTLPERMTMEELSHRLERNKIEEVENELIRVSDELGFIRESLRNLQEGFEHKRIDLDALHEEMMNESDVVRDEIRTIQTQIRNLQMLEAPPRLVTENTETFLMNWVKEEMKGVEKKSNVPVRDRRTFQPLLTKKQRKALERAELERTKPDEQKALDVVEELVDRDCPEYSDQDSTRNSECVRTGPEQDSAGLSGL
ncbi:hypothetical protein R3P38DRAFT_3451883 [Favolaschia claudopus]|uniref:Uncharacterized protein n=1 Tax=Favolaschia claudopus TaxID=2862362 RepID=A0AAV9ZL20_9AGAR